MLPVNEAETLILDLIQPLQETEIIALEAAAGRILAQPVTSKLDFPYWDNSAMDGYAVKYKDVEGCQAEQPVILEIIEEIPAGKKPEKSLKSGQTARIFTGAMLPEGADTIIMQENTERLGNQVKILAAPSLYKAYVRQKGEYYQAGKPLLGPGIAINAPEIAVLATAQATQLTVYRRLKVAIFSSGDELVTPHQPLQPGQIVDSNQYALAAFVASQGATAIPLGIVPDDPENLRETISRAIKDADVVLSTGGVSVGEYDYIEEILATLGADIKIRAVGITPGKPLTVARFSNGCIYFGIPGNPVSALVSCWRFVQPAMKKLSGLKDSWKPVFIKARSRHDLRSKGRLETYVWGKLLLVDGVYEFELAAGTHSSGNLINLAQTNGLAVMPVGQSFVGAGEEVTVLQVGSPYQ
ncbi:gephyrin-like molybdotransferase Glp [Gloeothece verrucosa]|uniref:Molybdopterin molybdenumtransferase n=1 Tax=Gloeothece verrucosa (strain PCC 7822) TaxID=497965 RepID=E0U7V7_GLOV7|nr:gephyrin-like molybdotransferase Glp [Gloeothece verrucosa]ADN16044.1 molybdenum cofactor synthesis domain protein [Gloeothece verrucosa PCC 7822]